ncbi:MAG TPA: 3-oxoacyl-[acyl-carrier-protein] synthase III C-terminal domain-containing protein [Verrucomicrobiae bacterium]|nr:3-oxoacyl-[acyl-carrier-protein] synthase III C-terminal domain-containing protein [Verrucomicrobiae bacterium]
MFLAGLGTATPPNRFTQRDCWTALQNSALFATLKPRSQTLLEKVLCSDNGIATRHLALQSPEEAFNFNPDLLQARFANHAPELAAQAARQALADAGRAVADIDAVLISTCTGYLCPGLTSYVGEKLGLRPDVFALDLVGQGCGAALPNLRTAEALLAAGRAETVLSICVEICSAAFFLDDDPGVLISACLFGDGAGAAVLSAQLSPKQRRRVEWKSSASCLAPEKRDALRFTHRNGMLRNILLPEVPRLAGQEAAKLFAESLARAGLERDAVRGWIFHTGGRDVLSALRERFALETIDLRHSASVLRDFGNVSSPTVFFVLERALHDTVPDGLWWMSAFGAGFSCHGALLHVES